MTTITVWQESYYTWGDWFGYLMALNESYLVSLVNTGLKYINELVPLGRIAGCEELINVQVPTYA
jgi:hypothetical protein